MLLLKDKSLKLLSQFYKKIPNQTMGKSLVNCSVLVSWDKIPIINKNLNKLSSAFRGLCSLWLIFFSLIILLIFCYWFDYWGDFLLIINPIYQQSQLEFINFINLPIINIVINMLSMVVIIYMMRTVLKNVSKKTPQLLLDESIIIIIIIIIII